MLKSSLYIQLIADFSGMSIMFHNLQLFARVHIKDRYSQTVFQISLPISFKNMFLLQTESFNDQEIKFKSIRDLFLAFFFFEFFMSRLYCQC